MTAITPRHVDLGVPVSFEGGGEAVWVGEAQGVSEPDTTSLATS